MQNSWGTKAYQTAVYNLFKRAVHRRKGNDAYSTISRATTQSASLRRREGEEQATKSRRVGAVNDGDLQVKTNKRVSCWLWEAKGTTC